MALSKPEVLVSGKTSFKIEVPYKLFETGRGTKEKPLIIYLHGFGENIESFQKKCKDLLKFEAYHLFIQGPYPLYDRSGKKNVSQWGRAWYLYDGNRQQFIKSLELTSEFLQEVVDNLLKVIQVNRLCIMGYSMGGYVAGYFALTRWKHVNELIVAGARIKTEVLKDDWGNIKHLNVLALHGRDDEAVKADPQIHEIEKLQKKGVKAELKLLNESHSFTGAYVNSISEWLNNEGYKEVKK